MMYNILTNYLQAIMRTIGIIGLQILVFYVNINYLLPKYYSKKKFLHYGLFNASLLFISVYTIDFLIHLSFYIKHLGRRHSYTIGSVFEFDDFNIRSIEIIFNHMMPILFAIFVSFMYYNFKEQKKREEKEVLLAKAEKSFLVSQINPHFLFNILNNIYSLTLDNNLKGAQAIMELSKMLDYSLYGASKNTVSLKEEIQYINHFISLFMLKDDEIKNVTFNFDDVNPETQIAPMLLIPFVENAFKHGSIEDVINGSITITLKTRNGTVLFDCKNSFLPEKSVDQSSGIGIANVIRRLELLYPNRHEISILKKGNYYNVHLIISTQHEA